jgi:hypothetical protein
MMLEEMQWTVATLARLQPRLLPADAQDLGSIIAKLSASGAACVCARTRMLAGVVASVDRSV